MTEIMNLTDASAIAAILHAVDTKAPVARLDGVRVLTGRASHISRADNRTPGAAQDVRGLYLYVQDTRDVQPRGIRAWLIRDLVAEYRTGAFVTDFDRDAFEAAGGQAAVPASVAAFEAASARPLPGSPQPEGEPGRKHLYRTYDAYGREVTPIDTRNAIYRQDQELLKTAREWIADVFGDEIVTGNRNDPVVKALIRAMVQGHYAGGWPQFFRDHS